MMKIYKAKDYKQMSRAAANIISAQIILKHDSILGLATGSSPLGIYENLVDWYKKGDLDFSAVTSVNLDEYVGIKPDNEQSYRYFMNENFFKHINIDMEKTFVPDGTAEDPEKECERYNKIIEDLGCIDLQLLGIGKNGHIGFNEPGEIFEAETHKVKLTESTIEANKRFFNSADEVPKYAMSMGIKNIMNAKKIVVVASGEEKADAVHEMVYGKISPKTQCTILQLHNDVIVVGDEAAMSKIDDKDIFMNLTK